MAVMHLLVKLLEDRTKTTTYQREEKVVRQAIPGAWCVLRNSWCQPWGRI